MQENIRFLKSVKTCPYVSKSVKWQSRVKMCENVSIKVSKKYQSVRKVSEKCQIVLKSVLRVYKAHFFDTWFSKRAGCRHFFNTLQGRTENQAHYFDTPFLHAEKTGHFVRHCSPTLFSKKLIKSSK